MKNLRLLFTLAVVLFGLTAMADDIDDTFQFVDEEGNVIADGSEITVKGLTEDSYSDPYIDSGLYVLNTTDEMAGVGLTLSITEINGVLSCCFPSLCANQSTTLTDYDNGKLMMEANELRTLHTDYTPLAYGTCTAIFQLRLHEPGFLNPGDFVAYGPKITVHFVYDETSAGISGVPADESEIVGYYTLDGKKLEAPQAGVNIVKYADGKSVKTIFKH